MEKLLVSVFDCKAESWSVPAGADNMASAIRMFSDLVRDNRTLVGQHPEDFSLWIVGSFDISTGKLKQIENYSLARGNDFVKKGSEDEVSH